jgi:hypothetical protein
MAKKIIAEDITENSLISNDGQESFRLTLRREEYEDGDVEGNIIQANNIEAGDGSTFGLNQLNQGMTVKRCDICTQESQRIFFRKSIMPFSPSTSIRSCHYCRKNLCSRHFHILNNHTICKKCLLVQKYLKPVFFKRVRES